MRQNIRKSQFYKDNKNLLCGPFFTHRPPTSTFLLCRGEVVDSRKGAKKMQQYADNFVVGDEKQNRPIFFGPF